MLRKYLLLGAAIAVAGAGVYVYHRHSLIHPATDNAYIGADVVHVAPQVSGAVEQVAVLNQQAVARGDPLYGIECRPFELVLDEAQAKLAQARLEAAQNAAAVASARATLHHSEVMLANAKQHAERTAQLRKTHSVSQQQADDAQADYLAAQAQLAVDLAGLHEAQSRLGTPGDDNEAVLAARAAVAQAQWDLDHTEIHAPCAGRVAELTLHAGDHVNEGQADFVLICSDRYWVDANFKETQLTRIRVGQPVEIGVDMYPDRRFHGEVESISGASGVAFSMLPPENATGNWVKVTQRVPVRIRIGDPSPETPLRVGTSARVAVDTSDAARSTP